MSETKDFTLPTQSVLLTFDFLEVQMRSLEIFYQCGVQKVFPCAIMSQEYNYNSQKCRLRKPVQLKMEIVITRDWNDHKNDHKISFIFSTTKLEEEIETTPDASSASPCSVLR